jgi:hypothetical protein
MQQLRAATRRFAGPITVATTLLAVAAACGQTAPSAGGHPAGASPVGGTSAAPPSAVVSTGTPRARPTTAAPARSRDPITAAAARPRWAGSTRFMQIDLGSIRGGTVYLQVRPAKKQALGESFETVTVPGPYTDVAVVPNARILLTDGESGTPEAFVGTLEDRTKSQRSEGFDVTFDDKGRVSQVDWLYVL